jgi:hypothetical protein
VHGDAAERERASSDEEYLAKLGLSEDVYRKRLKAARVVAFYPVLWTMLEEGRTHLAQLAMLYSHLTEANSEIILAKLPGMSKRELETLLAKVGRDGSVSEAEAKIEIRLTLTESELAVHERAREVLSASGHVPNDSEIFAKALAQLVEAKDPLRKAERAMQRKERAAQRREGELKEHAANADAEFNADSHVDAETRGVQGQASDEHSTLVTESRPVVAPGPEARQRVYIPAEVIHAVYLRDKGQCAEILPDGRRCPERRMVEKDHRIPWCWRGEDSIKNLRLMCRAHNQAAARRMLGEAWVGPHRRRPPDSPSAPGP